MSDTPQPPNMDLIRMVQQARMQHDSTAQPSQVSATYWIEYRSGQPAPAPTARSGEFRLHIHAADADAHWDIIKRATDAGQLGYKSKISTRPTPDHPRADGRTICVRTYDSTDTADVQRVRDELARLGFSPTIYVTDQHD